jgi:hypothetical protein
MICRPRYIAGVAATKTPVTVHLLLGTTDRIKLVTTRGKAQRRKLSGRPRWKKRRTASASAERAALRAAWTVHLDKLRRGGKILDTVPAIAELGARRLLAVRGWDHDRWPAVPREMQVQGRWPGSTRAGTGEQINLRVDAALVARVRAACWGTSRDAIAELYLWRDAHPGPLALQDDEAMAEYERLAEQVVTPGDFWRDALEEVLPLFRPADRPPLDEL